MNFMADAQNLRVMVVDDDEVTRDITIAILESLGIHNCEHAANGRIAMRLLRESEHLPELVITDIYMPEMDGFELVSALAEGGFSGGVALCSGVSVENLSLARDVAEGMGIRLLGVFTKPVSKDSLEEIISRLRS